MPPKKDNKKELVLSEDDGTGILKNIVQFKIQFQVVTQNIQNIVIMYEWLNANSTERYDTGLIDQWNVVSTEPQQNPDDPPIVTYSYEKVFDQIRFIDSLAEVLSKKKLYMYFVNADDMKVMQEFQFDYSLMLNTPSFEFAFSKMRIMEILDFKFNIQSDKPLLHEQLRAKLNPFQVEIVSCENIPVQAQKSYELCYVQYEFYDGTVIKTDMQVQMQNMYFNSKHVFLLGTMDIGKHFETKPLKFELHDKDEVVRNDVKEELQLFDIEKWLQIEEEKNRPPEPDFTVDPKTGKKIPKKEVKKDDKKEVKKEVKKDAKKDNKKKEVKLGEPILEEQPKKQYNRNNHGVAIMNLGAFIHSNVREVDLLAGIVPRRVFEDTESNNLDLNTTARKNIPKVFTATNYLDLQATMFVKFEMSNALIRK
ncbi:unnamed protein product [Paramecium octaurelia]|uniref:Uncharacterized protein n=1 Tax=Paramecium octaurelia TaxID=43137 RepID=A0A8S1VCM0_PAROT|nr:unnamed protein product [Paramecium octaurelia]